ncbi:MAG: ROK family protein [Candidatus Acidiferrum sp.]
MPGPTERSRFVIGVDIGGTKVAAGVVNSLNGDIGVRARIPMMASGDEFAGLAAVTSAIDALLSDPGVNRGAVEAIGICAPGPLDPNTGIVINPPNLPCWRNFPLVREISRTYGLAVKLDNDANAAALAEALWGAGRDYKNIFYTTIGTGIGTGIIFDGKIYHGRTGAAAEGGHMTIDYHGALCTCGKRGCIEDLASGRGIARRAREKLLVSGTPDSLVLRLAGGKPDAISCENVGAANVAGDILARKVLQETADVLLIWLGNIVDLLEPEVIIIGGGISSMLQPFFEEMRARLPENSLISRSREIPIIPAFYGSESGVAGGAALCSGSVDAFSLD